MADPKIDDLYKEFSGQTVPNNQGTVDVDSLHREFSGGSAPPAAAPVPVPAPVVEPSHDGPPKNSLGDFIKGSVSGTIDKTKQAVAESSGQFSSGITDVLNNRPASGYSKMLLGAVSLPFAPYAGAMNQMGEMIDQNMGVPGKEINPGTGKEIEPNNASIGDRFKFVSGFGLPISKLGGIANAARPINKAIGLLVKDAGVDNLAQGIARLEANPRLSPVDVFPGVLKSAQELTQIEGSHQNTLTNFISNRAKGAKEEVSNIFNDSMGNTVNVVDKLKELKDNAKATGRNLINPAIAQSKPVDVSPVLDYLQTKIKPGVNSIISAGEALPDAPTIKRLKEIQGQFFNGKSQLTDPQRLHDLQSALRVEGQSLMSSSVGSERQKGFQIMQLRNKIVDAIDAASDKAPVAGIAGPYKSALRAYADDKSIDAAFHNGTKVLGTSSLEDRPEFLAEAMKNMSQHELEAFKQGSRVALDKQINGMRNIKGLKGTEVPQIEFNKQKLGMLFGKDEVNTWEKRLNDERDMADSATKLYQGSQTAQRLTSKEQFKLPEKKDNGVSSLVKLGTAVAAEAGNLYSGSSIPGLGLATVGALNVAGKAKHRFVDMPMAMKKNSDYVNMLTSTGADRDQVIQILKQFLPQPKQSLLQNVQTRLPIAP